MITSIVSSSGRIENDDTAIPPVAALRSALAATHLRSEVPTYRRTPRTQGERREVRAGGAGSVVDAVPQVHSDDRGGEKIRVQRVPGRARIVPICSSRVSMNLRATVIVSGSSVIMTASSVMVEPREAPVDRATARRLVTRTPAVPIRRWTAPVPRPERKWMGAAGWWWRACGGLARWR